MVLRITPPGLQSFAVLGVEGFAYKDRAGCPLMLNSLLVC